MIKQIIYDFSPIEEEMAKLYITNEKKTIEKHLEYIPTRQQMVSNYREMLSGIKEKIADDAMISFRYIADDMSLATVTVRYGKVMEGMYEGMNGSTLLKKLVEECPIGYMQFQDLLGDLRTITKSKKYTAAS